MGIRTTFASNAQAIDISKIADDLLADVIADHAAERFRASNRANRQVAGTDIAYSVSVDGRTIHAGRGEMTFPERGVAVVIRRTPGRRHSVIVDWLWEKLQPATLLRVIGAFGEIESLGKFAAILADPRTALLRYLITSYLRARFPAAMARIGEVKELYRYYRLARMAGHLLPGGTAELSADSEVLAWIARELRDRSPVLTGAYRDAHALYGDGRFIMAADAVQGDATLPAGVTEFSFTNTVPYARKIEMGKTKGGRDFVISVPNRIYERVAEDARNRFKGMAEIAFEMRAVEDGSQTPQRRAGRAKNRSGVRFPAIVLRF